MILRQPDWDLVTTLHLETTLLARSLIMTRMSLITLGHFPYCQKQHPKFHLASELYLAWPSSTFKNVSPIPSKHHQSCLLAKLRYRLLTKQTSLFPPCMHLCIPVSPTGTPFPLCIHLPHTNSIHLTHLEAKDEKPIKEFFLDYSM